MKSKIFGAIVLIGCSVAFSALAEELKDFDEIKVVQMDDAEVLKASEFCAIHNLDFDDALTFTLESDTEFIVSNYEQSVVAKENRRRYVDANLNGLNQLKTSTKFEVGWRNSLST